MNKKEFDLSGITAWHKAGYTGKGVKIGHIEPGFNIKLPFFHGKVLDPFSRSSERYANVHQQKTCDIIHQIAPEADIYSLPSGYPGKPGIMESLDFCVNEGIHLVSMSLGGSIIKEKINKEIEAYQKGVFLIKSAGNGGSDGLNPYTKQEHWFSVGACLLDNNGQVKRTSYSSIGEELDIMSFGNVYVHDANNPDRMFMQTGTSFACPFAVGMLALYYQWFYEQYGKFPTIPKAKEFIFDNCIDLEDKGFDINTGHGLFVLPKEIPRKEEQPEVNNPKYIIVHHSATATGDAETFRRAHMAKGWRNIGYHYIIGNGTGSKDGEVETGRVEYEAGAHAIGYNAKSIGICLVGNFDTDKPTPAQMASLENLVKDIMARHKIPVSKVLGHGEVKGAATVCPGKNFDIAAFRKRLEGKPVEKKDYEGHWAQQYIEKAINAGYMSGYPDGSFKPDNPITRAEFCRVLSFIIDKLERK